MHLKTLAITAAFLAGSTLGVAAQSTSAPETGSANISAATHCKDKVTGQAKLKSAANTMAPSGSGAGSATTGSGAAGSDLPSGSSSGSGTMSGGAAGSSASGSVADLPDCP